jgi:hypothetical protein
MLSQKQIDKMEINEMMELVLDLIQKSVANAPTEKQKARALKRLLLLDKLQERISLQSQGGVAEQNTTKTTLDASWSTSPHTTQPTLTPATS